MGSFETKFLKQQFVNKKGLEPVAERASPFVALCNKPRRGGKSIGEPAIFSGPQAFSYSLTAAQAVAAQTDRGSSMYDEWVSAFGQYHGEAVVSAMAVAAGKSEPEAYLKQITETLSSKTIAFTSIMAAKLLGPVGNSIGRVLDLNQGGADGEIELTIAGDALNFVKGMIVQASTGSGNGAATPKADLGYVSAVYPNADVTGTSTTGHHVKILDVNGAATQITATWADNDYLFRNGDIASGSDLSDRQVRSFQSWIPLTAASDTFNNVSRAQDARYSGFRIADSALSGMSILDRCQLLATVGQEQCGAQRALLYVVHPRTWAQLAQEVQTFGQHQFQKHTKIGVSVITIMTCNGEAQVVSDPHCKVADIWLFTQEDLMLYNVDGLPALDDADGNEMLRQVSAANYAIRFHAFTCTTVNGNPWHQGRCSSGVS